MNSTAQFPKCNHIFPGNEDMFLHPENGSTPIIIDTKKGKKDIKHFLFNYNDHIEVVKQYKNKLFAYSPRSENMQEPSLQGTGEAV